MSLRGRYVIDRLKQTVGRYVQLPVPPYHNPAYWEGVYRQLATDDVFEWGHLTLQDLQQYSYRPMNVDGSTDSLHSHTVTFGDTLGVYPRPHDTTTTTTTDQQPILVLGCGNSNFGQDLLQQGWNGPIVQVDVASRAIEAMSHKCQHWVTCGDMQLVQDDARVLSAFRDASMHAVVDKGTVDAIFCANDYAACQAIMQSVHRVLIPNGIFVLLSFSRPEFLLPQLIASKSKVLLWNVQIQKLEMILLYRFQKIIKHRRR